MCPRFGEKTHALAKGLKEKKKIKNRLLPIIANDRGNRLINIYQTVIAK